MAGYTVSLKRSTSPHDGPNAVLCVPPRAACEVAPSQLVHDRHVGHDAVIHSHGLENVRVWLDSAREKHQT